jgi:[ribosomal protein S5]-alanine N-acetyltransferase
MRDEDPNGTVGTDPCLRRARRRSFLVHSDPDVADWSDAWSPEQAAAAAAEMARQWQADRVGKLIAHRRSDGTLVGRRGLSLAIVDGKRQLELGWAVLRTARRQRFATELGRACLDYEFGVLGHNVIVSLPRCTTTPPAPLWNG